MRRMNSVTPSLMHLTINCCCLRPTVIFTQCSFLYRPVLQVKEVLFCLFGTGLAIKGPLSQKKTLFLTLTDWAFFCYQQCCCYIALWRW